MLTTQSNVTEQQQTGHVRDRRIARIEPLLSPAVLVEELPLRSEQERVVLDGRRAVEEILRGPDDRLLVVVGPCSVHDPQATLDYARRLSEQAAHHERDLNSRHFGLDQQPLIRGPRPERQRTGG